MVVKLVDASLLPRFWYAQEGQYRTIDKTPP